MENTDCRFLDPTAEVWSCEDCSCEGCKAAVNSFVESNLVQIDDIDEDAYEDSFYESCNDPALSWPDRGTYLARYAEDVANLPVGLDPSFVSDVDQIALEVLADRLAGHRTSYLWV